MLKKLTIIFLCVISLTICWWVNGKPIFSNLVGAERLEIYQRSNSSRAQIDTVNQLEYKIATNRYGEACVISIQDFKLKEIFDVLHAKLVFTETTNYGVSYYGFSPNIKYSKNLNGKKINVQVFVGESQVKIASPMIYGSY